MASKKSKHTSFISGRKRRTARLRAAVKAQESSLDQVAVNVPTKLGDVVLTRRHLLIGAAGVVAVAGIGVGSSVISKQFGDEASLDILSVPNASVTSMADFEQVDAEEYMYLDAEYELPYGTLLWANGSMAACLIPGDSGSPLNHLGVLFLSSGYCPVVLNQAVGSSDGFEIFDARGSENGLIWTEVNIMEGTWRVYAAVLDDDVLGEPVLLEEGDREWETPTLAAVGRYVYWQLLPSLSGTHTTEQSLLKKAQIGTTISSVVYQSTGRMATPPTTTAESVIISPRANAEGMYYQLTNLRAKDDAVLDTMVLPQSMRPLEIGYGTNGFNFSFDAIYNYGDGISNLGTYTPLEKRVLKEPAVEAPSNQQESSSRSIEETTASPLASKEFTPKSYSDSPWFALNRTPSAPACWCGNLFMIKSTHVVCGVNMENKQYFTLDTHSGSPDYGDYLATTGISDYIVTYTNIDDRPIDGDRMYCTLVKVYAPY
ncbi:MAG: Tat pathway signal protein [Eggerthellaceae bacterium]|nr:Tat pathway signal protein [Eggerthellaceae bacterium]